MLNSENEIAKVSVSMKKELKKKKVIVNMDNVATTQLETSNSMRAIGKFNKERTEAVRAYQTDNDWLMSLQDVDAILAKYTDEGLEEFVTSEDFKLQIKPSKIAGVKPGYDHREIIEKIYLYTEYVLRHPNKKNKTVTIESFLVAARLNRNTLSTACKTNEVLRDAIDWLKTVSANTVIQEGSKQREFTAMHIFLLKNISEHYKDKVETENNHNHTFTVSFQKPDDQKIKDITSGNVGPIEFIE